MATREGDPEAPAGKRRRVRIPHPHLPGLSLTQVKVVRLFTLLLLFSTLVLYAVFRSVRFQEVLRRRTEILLKEKLDRPVTIGGFDLSLFPPSFLVKDVVLANDPRGLPGPCFSAAEIELRGLPWLFGRSLELPKFRVVSPTIVFETFEDGTTNFSRLLPPKKGEADQGVDVYLTEAVIQRATFRFRNWTARIDVLLREAAFTARREGGTAVSHLDLGVRKAQLKIGEHETFDFALGIGADLSPGRLKIHDLHLRSTRLSLDAFGGIDNLRRPSLRLFPSIETRGEELGRLFGIGLPLTGPLKVKGALLVPEKGGVEGRASFEVLSGAFGPFPISGTGLLHVDGAGVLAHLTRAEYAGGTMEAHVRVERLKNPPIPVKLILRGRGLGFERFFADLGLPGTGMLGRADLDATLAWGSGGIERADGAGTLTVVADPAARSAVAGRHPLPTSGGGPILVRNGKILFDRMPLATQGGLRARLDGSIAIEHWTPDLAIRAETRDLAELERTAENWYAAIQKAPLSPPLRLAGSGRFEARLTRAFGDPRIEGTFDASSFQLRGARFGDASASFTVDRNVATFSPFSARDGAASISVTGRIGWGGPLGAHYRLDGLTTELEEWPLERILTFLDFDLPMTGALTGRLPLSGVTPALVGRAPILWEKGAAWQQPFDRIEGTLAFEGDRIRIADAAATLGGGTAKGSGFYRYADGGFDLALSVADVGAGAIHEISAAAPSLSGRLTATVSGEGTVGKPGLSLSGSIADARLGEEPVGEPGRPILFSAKTGGGAWDASLEIPGAASFRAATPRAETPRTSLRLSVTSLAPFARLLGLPPEAGFDGGLEVEAALRAGAADAPLEGEGSLSSFTAKAWDHHFSLARPVTFRIEKGRLRFDRAEVAETARADGTPPPVPSTASFSGSFGLEAPFPLEVAVAAKLDAVLLRPFVAPASLSGRLLIDGKVAGTASHPEPSGRAVLEGVDYRTAGGSAFEEIRGTLSVSGDRLMARDVSMRYAGGTVSLAATANLDGLKTTNLRASVHLGSLKLQPLTGFRATVSGDLRLDGDSTLRSARGEVVVDQAVYDADFSLDLGSLLAGKRSVASAPVAGPFDAVALDVKIFLPPSASEVRNNVARLKLRGDLLLRGNVGRPILYGQLEAEEGGRLKLRDQNYELASGKVIFSNPARIEPFFDVDARTSIRTGQGEYRVRAVLTGTPARLAARFSSEPPLTEAQIISLLASGTLPATATSGAPSSTSSDASVTQAARDLLTSLATEAFTSRTKQFFRLDRLQIDPNFQGTSFSGPRVTIGKTIGRNFTATVAYQFGSASNLQQQVITLEYQLSPTAFLRAVQDEYNVYSLEIKLRQQLR